ncbi:MAG: hypothetical protein ACE15C_10870 [Phycisphaerae bacterium]
MRRVIAVGLVLACAASASAQRARPAAPVRPVRPAASGDFSDQAIDQAIQKGQQFLWDARKPDGSWGPHSATMVVGPTAAAVYGYNVCVLALRHGLFRIRMI